MNFTFLKRRGGELPKKKRRPWVKGRGGKYESLTISDKKKKSLRQHTGPSGNPRKSIIREGSKRSGATRSILFHHAKLSASQKTFHASGNFGGRGLSHTELLNISVANGKKKGKRLEAHIKRGKK